MKTTEIHDHGGASSLRSAGRRPRGLARLRARIGADGRQRGAVAVEFALLLPLLVMLSFGIIEFSSAYHDRSVAADAARAGARVGSAQATQSGYEAAVVSAVNSAVSTLPSDVPKELWIYKANAAGYPGSSTGFTSCSTNCIKYTYSPGSKSFNSSTGSWAASSHQVCTQPYDEIGVYVKLQHPFVTKLFGASVTLSDHAVFRFEPVALAQCS
jgi:Flp pilus assembly protein TadG